MTNLEEYQICRIDTTKTRLFLLPYKLLQVIDIAALRHYDSERSMIAFQESVEYTGYMRTLNR